MYYITACRFVKAFYRGIVSDHKFAALHGALWSGGSFVYVPKGVNVKIPEIIARPAKWYTKNGKTTYYISTSEFSNASTATTIALIIGGEGTLTLEEFYLAATEEPAEKVIEYKNTTVYESGVELSQTAWWGTWTCEFVDGNLVSTGSENGCFGLGGFTPVPFKEGAKLVITAFGSIARIAKAAVKMGRKNGLKVGLFRPILVNPFPEKIVAEIAQKVDGILDIELNCGQMLQDIKASIAGVVNIPVKFYGRPAGVMMTVEEIYKQIENTYKEIVEKKYGTACI